MKKYLSSSLFSLSSGASILLALSTLNLSASAQSVQGASTPATPAVTVLHFTDGEDDHPGRMTTDTRGNVYIAAALGVQGRSGFAVLKYNSQNQLQVIRRTRVAGEFGGRGSSSSGRRSGECLRRRLEHVRRAGHELYSGRQQTLGAAL